MTSDAAKPWVFWEPARCGRWETPAAGRWSVDRLSWTSAEAETEPRPTGDDFHLSYAAADYGATFQHLL